MKKSIKYAGIAAATLLAVAPVAAPVVSQAADTTGDDVNTPASEFTTAKNKFIDQFGDVDMKDSADYSYLPIGENNAVSATDFLSQTKNLDIVKSALSLTDDKATLDLLDSKNVTYYLEATDAKGNVYDGTVNKKAYSLNKAIHASDTMLPVAFTLYAKNTDINGSGTTFKQVATFNLNKSDEGTELTSLNAKFTNPISVAKNSKTAVSQLVSTANASIVDQDGEAVSTQGTEVATGFFRTYAAAIDALKANTQAKPTTLGDDIKDGEFKTAGTYYQVVTYKAGADTDLENFITNYENDPAGYTIYVNGKTASAGYDFYVGNNSSVASESNLKTISFVRTVNVSDSESEWTTEDVSGQVTTKSDAAYYTLKNDDNNTISNRALAKNTDWLTDQKRTDQNGNVQYRVATGEWINADDVTFSKSGSNNNGSTEGALTDLQSVSGVVNLDTPGYVYFLYNKDGVQLTNRALTGGTSWRTDTVAKNANGDTMYRVATNEWLQAKTGLNYVAD